MKHLWIIDLCLAVLSPLMIRMIAHIALAEPVTSAPHSEAQYLVSVGPTGWLPLAAAFVCAAGWSRWRPRQALFAQILPAAVLFAGLAITAAIALDLIKH